MISSGDDHTKRCDTMTRISNNSRALFTLLVSLLVCFTVKGVSQEPRFSLVTRNVTVVAGQTAVLPCSVDYLGSYKVVWQSPRGKTLTLEDRRIIADERISLERPYVKEWNLHLRKVKTSDAGTYQCQINTDPVQVRGVMLHVNEPAMIMEHLSSSNTVHVKEGETVELVCNVTGFPSPSVTWFRTHTGLVEDGSDQGRKQIGMEGEVLIIHNVSRYCDDKYECVAYNGVPPADTREIRVHVEFPPEVRLPTKKLSQVQGKPTILDCEITAYPQIMTVWRKNGKDITRNHKYATELYSDGANKLTLSLRIHSVSEEDFGEYMCYAQNLLGSDAEMMVLHEYYKVEEKTSTVTMLTVPFTQDVHHVDENEQSPSWENRQKNSNGSPVDDQNLYHANNKDELSKSSSFGGNQREGYSQYSDIKSPKRIFESEAKSGSVISGPHDGTDDDGYNGASHFPASTGAAIIMSLLLYSICIR